MRWKRFALGALLAAAILIVLARRIDPHAVAAALRAARWWWLPAASALGLLSMYLKGERWALAIAGGGAPRPRHRVFAATLIGTAANLVLPARLGDFLRALVLRRHNAIPATQALLASWSAQAFDVLAVAVLLLLGAAAGQELASPRLLLLVAAGVVAGGAAAALVARRPEVARRAVRRLPGIGGRLEDVVAHAAAGLRFLAAPAVLLRVVVYTTAIWVVDVLGMAVALHAFRLDHGFAAAALLVAAIGLSFALPLTPGNVGTYQLLAVFVLGRFGVARDPAFAFGLGLQAYALVTTVALGGILFHREGLRVRDLEAADARAQAP